MLPSRCARPTIHWPFCPISDVFIKQFHSSPPKLGRPKAPSTTRIRRPLTEAQKQIRSEILPNSEIFPHSASLLSTALADGILGVDLRTAVLIAKKCILVAYDTGSLVSPDTAKKIHEDLDAVARVACVLHRSPKHRALASWVIHRLAVAGEPTSVIYLVNQLLRFKGPVKRTPMVAQLELIAMKGEIPQAMVVYGLILQRRRRNDEALFWFEKAMAISKPVEQSESIDMLLRFEIPQPWKAYGSLKADMQDHESARKALAVGAHEYDNELAYFLLAPDALSAGDLQKYEEYLTKAAMDGNPDACFKLGNLYLTTYLAEKQHEGTSLREDNSRSQGKASNREFSKKYQLHEHRKLAAEWHELAIAGGHGRAALVVAAMLRQEKELDKGMDYLNIAANDPKCVKAVGVLREAWGNDFKIDIVHELMKESKEDP